jgi:3-oxoacyl-[acyl-carrier protein] reductase
VDLKLQGKRALITGSSAGIGAAIARMLAAEGVAVVIHGRDPQKTRSVADTITKAGGKAAVAVGDLATEAGANSVIEAAEKAFGGIDILVNNAGGPVNPNSQGWFDTTIEQWSANYQNNTIPYVRMIKAFAPQMIERRWGRLIQISSRTATAPHPPVASYAASKAGITNLTVSLSKALAGTGVTANTVSPGLIYTPMLDTFLESIAGRMGWGKDMEKAKDYAVKNITGQTVQRLGEASDVAAAVVFLASPLADFIAGTNLHVDGGSVPTIN